MLTMDKALLIIEAAIGAVVVLVVLRSVGASGWGGGR